MFRIRKYFFSDLDPRNPYLYLHIRIPKVLELQIRILPGHLCGLLKRCSTGMSINFIKVLKYYLKFCWIFNKLQGSGSRTVFVIQNYWSETRMQINYGSTRSRPARLNVRRINKVDHNTWFQLAPETGRATRSAVDPLNLIQKAARQNWRSMEPYTKHSNKLKNSEHFQASLQTTQIWTFDSHIAVPEFLKGSFSAWKQAENAHFWKRTFSSRDTRGSETKLVFGSVSACFRPHQTNTLVLEEKMKTTFRDSFQLKRAQQRGKMCIHFFYFNSL